MRDFLKFHQIDKNFFVSYAKIIKLTDKIR